jgi:hypothetical protein
MLACFNQIEGQLHTQTCTCGRSPAAKHTQSWNVMNVIINLGPPRLHRFTGCPTQVKFFGKAALIQLWKDLSEQWTNQKPVLDMLVLMVKKWQEYLSLQYLHIDGLSWELRILSDHFVLSMIIIIFIISIIIIIIIY